MRFLCLFFLIMANAVFGQANRIFFEDCEDTTFSEWFLERSLGTSDNGYWAQLTSEITRSTLNPHSGSYCMTYDPWTNGNPHGNTGYITSHGNTSNFDLSEHQLDEIYITWYHRWETGIDYGGSSENKNIYIGYSDWGGDFVFILDKNAVDGWHIDIHSNPGYNLIHNWYRPFSGGNVEDNQWHKIEIYLNLGTTGATGIAWVKVDGIYLLNETGVTFRNEQEINGADLLLIQWPSNTSGDTPGTAVQWLDDLEIWDGLPGASAKPGTVENVSDPHNK